MQGSVIAIFILACAAGFTIADPGSGPDKYERVMFAFGRMLETNATWREDFEQRVAEDKADAMSNTFNYDFNCQVDTTPATPKTVHELRPQDINVIASLGDSITAGNGIDAWTAITVLREKRGESWCIGGDKSLEKGVHTITNVMRKFNPSIKGYSIDYGSAGSGDGWLNFAIPGAKAEDVPGETDRLIKKMKKDSRIDFDNDWKLITLLIGGNDLCDFCEDKVKYSPTNFKKHLQESLDKLHAEVPRALVNLVPMADVSPVPSIRTGLTCTVLHWSMCNCARNDLTRPDLKPTQVRFHDAMQELASGGRYDTRDDFTVVLQPHLLNQDFPKDPKTGKYDKSYIAPDCFHPNRKAHQGLNFFYWNTMLTPVGQKPTSHDLSPSMNTAYKCPTTEHPYIYTNQNSPSIVAAKPTAPPKAPALAKPSMLHKILQASKPHGVPKH